MNITVIGMGNIFNLTRAISFAGGNATIAKKIEDISNAEKIILPGVGNFRAAMGLLKKEGLDDVIRDKAKKGTPILGICLGQQLLMDWSEEKELTKGLGLISGKVDYFYNDESFDKSKVPNIGWRPIMENVQSNRSWDNTILKGVKYNEQCYFVHSLCVKTESIKHALSLSNYGGVSFASTIQNDNIFGCQFHPEKSGSTGLKILKNFITI